MALARKKQNRGIETRQKILSVTQQLISDHDFYSVTLDQIAVAADISKSSLLWHFESKELLLSEAACELFSDLERVVILEKDDSLSLHEKFTSLLEKVADYFENNPEPKGVLISLIFNSQIPDVIRERIDAYWEHHIDTLVDYFSSPEKPFAKSAARSILSSIHGTYMQWYLHQDKSTYRAVIEDHFKYFKYTESN